MLASTTQHESAKISVHMSLLNKFEKGHMYIPDAS